MSRPTASKAKRDIGKEILTGIREIERGSDNVYADLGFEDAERMRLKADLVAAIAEVIAQRALTGAAAAELLGLTQPKLSNLLRGHFRGISEYRLMDCLTRLGCDVQIVIRKKPTSRAVGRLSVLVSN